ncbi:GMC oxidoreductase [Aaosphaeria arxii CBS 175.79]|uniref:GMC oxidoreductase n=1 Tax=Aaosphaeria arxii CBS 175.79 TaxID=1450172 RepID=A0A6A5Y6E5_9PLEO|nr:GMC oxidoreductase [Aaosphaeria arxii CBS 175.79]KAF2021135.1 GMC oxidoreductase [Aaosphaeria arxii CBS 175.79]
MCYTKSLNKATNLTHDTFDFIIIGGGTAGLVLANRLSTLPSLRIAVIEAGDSVLNNSVVTDILGFPNTISLPINYAYSSAPQKYTDDRVLQYSGGRALGGTTTINGMTYLRAEREQIDSWGEFLGNEGWSWDELFPYYLKQEGFERPGQELEDRGAAFEEGFHGEEGPVATGFTPYLTGQDFFGVMRETHEGVGIPWNRDANGGRMRGFTAATQTLNATALVRADAARSYYYPVAAERPNLSVFLNTTALRIVWDEERRSSSGEVVARGVEVETQSGSIEVISLSDETGEIISSAGSIRSPGLLENSGVGNPSILEPLGITPVIDLPGVGGGLQDQPNIQIIYNSSTNWTGFPSFATFLTAADIFPPSDLSVLRDEITANISAYASTIVASSPRDETTQSIQEHLLAHHASQIFTPNSTIPLAEIIWFPMGTLIGAAYWTLFPFSRGNIHITSPNSTHPPAIQPNFFHLDLDTHLLAATSKKVLALFSSPPLSSYITPPTTPLASPFDIAELGYRDPRWATWIKGSYGSNNHPVATCAMMPRELNGVVDAGGRVYGVSNVRVVDAGTLPAQLSGHLSASVYAVAEKIADGILGERKGGR